MMTEDGCTDMDGAVSTVITEDEENTYEVRLSVTVKITLYEPLVDSEKENDDFEPTTLLLPPMDHA